MEPVTEGMLVAITRQKLPINRYVIMGRENTISHPQEVQLLSQAMMQEIRMGKMSNERMLVLHMLIERAKMGNFCQDFY